MGRSPLDRRVRLAPRFFGKLGPVQLGTREGCARLGVGNVLGLPAEGGELASPPLPGS